MSKGVRIQGGISKTKEFREKKTFGNNDLKAWKRQGSFFKSITFYASYIFFVFFLQRQLWELISTRRLETYSWTT